MQVDETKSAELVTRLETLPFASATILLNNLGRSATEQTGHRLQVLFPQDRDPHACADERHIGTVLWKVVVGSSARVPLTRYARRAGVTQAGSK